MSITESILAVGLSIGTLVGCGIAGTVSADAATTLHAHHSKPVPASAVACKYEDGSGSKLPCYWDAGEAGNGGGLSFWVDRQERVHYFNPRADFKERMAERGFRRFHSVEGHRLCFIKVGDTSRVRCFDGFRAES